jgi:hypothetical protein
VQRWRPRAHRFALFIANLRGTGFWLRLYLFAIDDAT